MISTNMYGRCAELIPDSQNSQITVDTGLLLERMLLFDTFILNSMRLREIPVLAKILSVDGLIRLLESGVLKIHCEILAVASLGQANINRSASLPEPLPLYGYTFSNLSIVNYDHHLEKILGCLNDIPNVSEQERQKLERLVRKCLVTCSPKMPTQALRQFYHELAGNLPLASVRSHIDNSAFERLTFSIHQAAGTADWKVETNLSDIMQIDHGMAHKKIERSLLDISGLTQRLFIMEEFNTISEFRDQRDTNLFYQKLKPLGEMCLGRQIEDDFIRVLSIRGFPNLSEIVTKDSFSVEKFLKIRNSDECRDFRVWIRSLRSASDSEIDERLSGFKAKMGDMLKSNTGRIIRLAINSGLGLLNPVGGATTSIIDGFILDKFIRRDGVSAFINRLYPSLFKGG